MAYGSTVNKQPRFHSRVQNYRFDRRVSQTDLAKVLGISRQKLSMIENGRRQPSLYLAMQIAKYFRVQVETLFWYNGA